METSVERDVAVPVAGVIGADEDASYRTLSVMALVSLVIGIAAPLCVIAPLLFAIPIAGVALALLAIRRIDTSDGLLIGRTAALIGLALCVASICLAVTRSTLSEHLLSRQAQAAALEWFALLQSGDAEQAFERTIASRKSPPPVTPTDPTPAADLPKPLDMFRDDPVVHFLLTHAKEAPVQFVQDMGYIAGARGDDQFQQQYRVAASEEGSKQPTTDVELVMQRVQGSQNAPSQWLVSAYQSSDLKPHTHEDGHSHSDSHDHGH